MKTTVKTIRPRKHTKTNAAQSEERKRYESLKRKWHAEHPLCGFRGCIANAEIHPHHIRGRLGALLCDTRFWLPVCRKHHNWIHEHPNDAREMGFLAQPGEWNRQVSYKSPDVTKAWTFNLWYEDKEENRFPVCEDEIRGISKPPSVTSFPYCLARFPTSIVTTIYKRRKDGSYGTVDRVGESSSSVPGDLAVLMVMASKKQDGKFGMSLDHALVIASTACERCMNILAHKHGLPWGYAEGSLAAEKCKTSCELCR